MHKITRSFITLILLITGLSLRSQIIGNLSFGTDSTLEVMTWNLEQFPKDGQVTVDYITDIITALDVDVIALQEIDDRTLFNQLLQNLVGYSGYIGSGNYLNLAYIYKSDVVEINQIYEIYTSSAYSSPFPRTPLVIDFSYKGNDFFVINNHLKCCGDGVLDTGNLNDEESRRYQACNLLRQYIDAELTDKRVIVVGDMNDEITDNVSDNVFQNIINDTENYLFTDMEIAMGSSAGWSYPTWPSHLDHIFITNELFPAFENEGSEIQALRIDEYLAGGWNEYDNHVSDHRPVAIKFLLPADLGIEDGTLAKSPLSIYPNPVTDATTLSFPPANGTSEITICNLQGQRVYTETICRDQTSVKWNAAGVAGGIYFARLSLNGIESPAVKLVVVR